jgi:ABC-type transporter Mla MlaB component
VLDRGLKMEADQKKTTRRSRKGTTMNAVDKPSIALESTLTIHSITDCKTKLTPLLASTVEIFVDCSNVGVVDTAGMQLLIAFNNEIKSRGNKVKWLCSDAMHDVANMMGLSKYLELTV